MQSDVESTVGGIKVLNKLLTLSSLVVTICSDANIYIKPAKYRL